MSASLHRLSNVRRANETVKVSASERQRMTDLAAGKIRELFDILHIDHVNDHNTRDTPERVARMLVEDVNRGRFCDPPAVTTFDNPGEYDELIVTGPISVVSTCAHHMLPIYGEAYIGILPSPTGRLVGLSKYDRIVDHFAGRLQIQEELVRQIGQHIMDLTAPRGVAVRISAVHMCKTHRGVFASRSSRMVTTTFLGEMQDGEAKRQFIAECNALERSLSCR